MDSAAMEQQIRRLQKELQDLREENEDQFRNMKREIQELRAQIAATKMEGR